jgi:diguanylate cyclase (GGDEF)-like protein
LAKDESTMQQTITRLHDDFTQRVVVHTTAAHGSPSPQTGVERRKLGEKLKLEWKYG